tara:strand:+ start:12904 stop:13590 length:687 start_codon:yes stop_codon:yes gene_type:complete
MKNKYLILSEKPWHKKLYLSLSKKYVDEKWILINNKEKFNLNNLKKLNPKKIFIPHWSYIIPSSVYNNYDCIVFHMTDLPYGRGGSPLQNLISRGFKKTKMSALKVNKGIDAGDIYLKKKLNLDGTAEEIFIKASDLIYKMIIEIIEKKIVPKPQKGEITVFKRRTPKESKLEGIKNLETLYDNIRMLDAKEYPKAFIENSNFKFEFNKAKFNKNKNLIIANVRIYKK